MQGIDTDIAPRVIVGDTLHSVAEAVAAAVAGHVAGAPSAVLGLATGATMVPVYAALVRAHRDTGLSFARCTSFNLDEYVGLAATHPASFARFMQAHLFAHADFAAAATHLPRGMARDLAREADRYERAIADAGGIGLQVLGIGANGHIGFNEPGSAFDTRTRVVDLAAPTRAANQAGFPPGEPVPARALTMGIATILGAGQLVLAATGARKAAAVAACITGAIGPHCPASALRLHPRVTIILDRAAASRLN